jgi:hypothetical protein
MGHIAAIFVVVMRSNIVHEILIIIEERVLVEDSLNPLKLHEVAGFQGLDLTLASIFLVYHK